jgi:hypothetical protein
MMEKEMSTLEEERKKITLVFYRLTSNGLIGI